VPPYFHYLEGTGELTLPAELFALGFEAPGGCIIFQKRVSALAYLLPFLCHSFCSDMFRKVLSCSARVLPDQR
jgi:hypothetical protein